MSKRRLGSIVKKKGGYALRITYNQRHYFKTTTASCMIEAERELAMFYSSIRHEAESRQN